MDTLPLTKSITTWNAEGNLLEWQIGAQKL